MNARTISVLHDFSEYPALRYCNLSDHSGEEFYHKVLNGAFKQAFEQNENLIVDLDGTDGYTASFLDEAFGNLVYDFTLDVIKKRLEIVSLQVPHWKKMIESQTFDQWETRRKKSEPPVVTAIHPAWYRLVKSTLQSAVWEKPSAAQTV